jgi:hypothetical protein
MSYNRALFIRYMLVSELERDVAIITTSFGMFVSDERVGVMLISDRLFAVSLGVEF